MGYFCFTLTLEIQKKLTHCMNTCFLVSYIHGNGIHDLCVCVTLSLS